MNINLICLGSVKEKFYKDAISEYIKRLSRYTKICIIELKDEKIPLNASELEEEKIKKIEASRILSKIKKGSYNIALDLKGKRYTSESFSKHIKNLELASVKEVNFIIGASLGLDKEILELADESLSFSDFTFPHHLIRLIFLEQLYRAYKIINNEPYHK